MPWRNTTHDWAHTVDLEHLAEICQDAAKFAPGGIVHLIHEVIAYAADEAESTGTPGRCVVIVHDDGSVSVADNGRGTDTRYDEQGRPIKKPVMATKDLRFFDSGEAQQLPDGTPRRGMSVVAALSEWLVHTNHRDDAAWTQRYERGIPVTDLISIPRTATTGTTVHFSPDASLDRSGLLSTSVLSQLVAAWPQLTIQVGPARAR